MLQHSQQQARESLNSESLQMRAVEGNDSSRPSTYQIYPNTGRCAFDSWLATE